MAHPSIITSIVHIRAHAQIQGACIAVMAVCLMVMWLTMLGGDANSRWRCKVIRNYVEGVFKYYPWSLRIKDSWGDEASTRKFP